MLCRINVCVFFTLFFAGSCSAAGIDAIVEKITKSRNKIDSYHLIIVHESYKQAGGLAPDGKKDMYRKLRFEIWHKGNKTRLDIVAIDSLHESEPAGQRIVRCRNCEKAGHILQAHHGPGGTSPVTFEAIDSFLQGGDMTDMNWPWIGLANGIPSPWFYIPQDNFLKSFLNLDPAHVLPMVDSTAKLNDLECRRFTINGKTLKRQKSMWVDPRRDDSPIRLETTNNGQIQNETTFTYPAKPADGIWFPATIQQRLVWKNESINNYTIELAEFNQRISDTVFSYGGLGLLDDLPVLIDGPGDVMKAPRLRDGKVVYPETKGAGSRDMPPPFMAVPDHMPSSWWSRLPYIAGALLFALIGVTLLRKMVWRLRA